MDLKTYILETGRERAARIFGVSYPTVCHWVNGVRRPSPDQAKKIISKSPVDWAGIYGDPLPRRRKKEADPV